MNKQDRLRAYFEKRGNEHNCVDMRSLRLFYMRNFYEFLKEVLGFSLLQEVPHREICDFVAFTPGDGSVRTSNIPEFPLVPATETIKDLRRLGLFIPRDHFKTTIDVGYPVWRWCSKVDECGAVFSATYKKAEDVLRQIKGQLSGNDTLIALFGNMGERIKGHEKEGLWSNGSIQLTDPGTGQYVPFQHTPSCSAFGMDGNYTGNHYDWMILDDLVVPQNVTSPDQLEKTSQFLKDVEPTLNFGATKLISGTRYSWGDAYGKVIDNANHDILLRRAHNPDGTLYFAGVGLRKKHLKLSYDERVYLSGLYLKGKRKEVGPQNYACQYDMLPINPESANFKTEWIEAALCDRCPIPKNELRVILVVDPAAGGFNGVQKKTLDATGIVALGIDWQGTVWCLHVDEVRIGPRELAHKLVNMQQEWNAERICIEEVGFQSYLEPIIENCAQELGAKVFIKRVKQSTRKSKNHRIVARLSPLLESGRFRMLRSQSGLINEFYRFDSSRTNNKDNLLDCVEMGMRELRPPEPEKKEISEEDITAAIEAKRKSDMIPNWNRKEEEPGTMLEDIFYGGVQ